MTKQMARLQTREDILRRKQIAQSAPDEDSDAEEQAAKAKSAAAAASSSSGAAPASAVDEMENLLDVGEKVRGGNEKERDRQGLLSVRLPAADGSLVSSLSSSPLSR